jgi:hypothetical protein
VATKEIKMIQTDMQKVSKYLTGMGIEHTLSDDMVVISRKSVVKTIPQKLESDSYAQLLNKLNVFFSCRFAYMIRDPDYLHMDRLG